MRNLDELIAMATIHVERGQIIVERQRELIEQRPHLDGALELLVTFERSQAVFEDDLARLIRERDRN
jgi:hypothetical protein